MDSVPQLVNLYHNSPPSSADQRLAYEIVTQLGKDFPSPEGIDPYAKSRWRWLVNADSKTRLVTVENFAFSERMGVKVRMSDIDTPTRLKKRVRKEVGEFIERYVLKVRPDEDVLTRAIVSAPFDRRQSWK